MQNNLVNIDWLKNNLDNEHLIILDATLPKATDKDKTFGTECIPNALFFDIKNVFSKQNQPFPNTLPSLESFEMEARLLGVNSDSIIVVYDQYGIYSSPRAWWLFKLMGHQHVFVLNGGFIAWKDEKLKTNPKHKEPKNNGDFSATYHSELVKFKEDVLISINDSSKLVLDARSNKRFLGTEPEPREGLRAGHIPNSKNLHYSSLTENGKLLPPSALKLIFDNLNATDYTITYSCGSGITACILALAGTQTGINDFSIYDGSWTEWGTLKELPIE